MSLLPFPDQSSRPDLNRAKNIKDPKKIEHIY
jgi:hypothetical protein